MNERTGHDRREPDPGSRGRDPRRYVRDRRGLIIIPVLILLFHDSPKTAIGTSLFALIWPAGLLGAIEYWKTGHVRPVQGAWIAVGSLLGGYLGARITLSLQGTTMKRASPVFLLIVGLYFLFSTRSDTNRPLKLTPLNPAPIE